MVRVFASKAPALSTICTLLITASLSSCHAYLIDLSLAPSAPTHQTMSSMGVSPIYAPVYAAAALCGLVSSAICGLVSSTIKGKSTIAVVLACPILGVSQSFKSTTGSIF
jgi:hypothetical protein